jgi:cellulose synthase/poly-beta-1,6-N-acetylglucosamine synthase-like glycosyltransferase
MAVARRLLPPQSPIRHKLNALLVEHFPQLHDRLKRRLRGRSTASMLDSTPMALTGRMHSPSSLHPVLSDPDLLSLARPKAAYLDPESLHRAPTGELLEPVVEMNQMRQSPASVCFVVPVRNKDVAALERTLQSVLRQTDPCWELLFGCDKDHSSLVSDWLETDWRVRRVEMQDMPTESHWLKAAAREATTVFVGLLSQGDVIDDDLVKRIGDKLRRASELDIVYTDEACRLQDDKVSRPFYKPDWSPEHQQSVNMLGRFTAIRKKMLLSLPEPHGREEAAAEYELALAAAANAASVAHIDDLLYFKSASGAECAPGGFFPREALEEARTALERQVRGECSAAKVEAVADNGSLRVVWPEPSTPITLVILTGMYERDVPGRGKIVLATHFVRSIISNSTSANYKILVVDDGFVPEDLGALLATHGHSSVSYPKQKTFSFADKANFGTAQVREGIVILLNDDLEVIAPDWIQTLASQAARPGVGAVGGKLLFPDGSLQHAGIALGFHGSAGHVFHRAPESGDYAGFASMDRNYSAVTGAVMAYRKEVFDEVGGFDLRFSTDYNDLDFCLKCIEAGYRVVYTPSAKLYHFHNSSLNRVHDNAEEKKAFLQKWGALVARDPYFSKHFQKDSQDRPLLEPRS